jgi:hypothetical protein
MYYRARDVLLIVSFVFSVGFLMLSIMNIFH